MAEDDPQSGTPSARLSLAGWIAILVLFLFLAWATWYAVHVWAELSGVAISPAGWVFVVLGAVVTLAVGVGLMGLVFYSSRHHYDR